MLERTLQELLVRLHRQVWPELDLEFVEAERHLVTGRPDLVFRSPDGFLVVELKADRITRSAVEQLSRYVLELTRLEPAARWSGMAVAPTVAPDARRVAGALGLDVHELDVDRLERLAAGAGLPVGPETGHRPRPAHPGGKAAPAARPLATGRGGRATPRDIVSTVQALHARFPPGTLTAATADDVLHAYWSAACPSAPAHVLRDVVALTRAALEALPGSALGPRSQSRSRGWATSRTADGRVTASFEARASRADVSFYADLRTATALVDARKARLWGPRGYGYWVESAVQPGQLGLQEAVDLLTRGAQQEFERGASPR